MGESDVKRLSLIDVSFEDNRLVGTPPARPVGSRFLDGELLHHLDLEKADEEGKKMASAPHESSEERASQTPENYHLRKSLAWDTAFFTSDGVLEPEELTSMIEDAGKKEKHTLPMIVEETLRSTESISTLASDTLTLASLEADLFEDIRASIQKSSKTSNFQTFGSKAGQSSFGAHAHHYLRKRDLTSQGKPAPKNSSLGMMRPGKMTNQVPVHRRVSQVQSVAEGRDSSSSSLPSKPPKPGMHSLIPSSKKRESSGPNHMKPKKDNMEAKLPVSRGTRSTVPRPSSSSSLACSASVKTKMITRQSDGSVGSSSDKSKKASVNLGRKAFGPKSRKLSSASSSMLETPPRSNPSHLSAYLAATTKLSIVSPASSISEWSLESSSSASTVKQGSNDSRASLEQSSSDKISDDGDRLQLDGPKTHGSSSSNLHLKNTSTGGALLPDSMRPSSLRMPSPKIGFFDGMKLGRTPNANQQLPQVDPTSLPKIGEEISKADGTINGMKVVKFQPKRATTAINSMKGDSKQLSSGRNWKSLPRISSNSAEKVPNASRNVKGCSPGMSPRGLSKISPKSGCQNRMKAEEVKARESDVKTCHDNESPEVKPISDAGSSRTDAIDGKLKTLNLRMELVDKAGGRSPFKLDSHVENGSVFDRSLTDDSSRFASYSGNLPVNDQVECLNSLSKLSLSTSISKTDVASGARQPFSAIDSFCNMDDSSAISTRLATTELGKRIASPPQSSLSDNS